MKLTWTHGRRIRQVVQIFFFALFVYLLFAGLQHQEVNPLANLFFRLNPLSALAAMLASRRWLPDLAWALIIVALTIIVGRVWCGWICPTGTLLEWISFRQARLNAYKISPRLRLVKYLSLVIILAAALFGNASLLIFEPLALFTRAMTEVVIPGLNYAINASEEMLYSLSFLRPLVDGLESMLRGTVLPVKQPAFNSPFPVAVLFFGIIALNLLADRFWCRYLCPLGALLGWLAKISIFRPLIGSVCNGCTRCAIACKPEAIQTVPKADAARNAADIMILPSECTVCLDCLASCAKEGISIQPVIKQTIARQSATQEFSLSRRQFLLAVAGGAAGVMLLRTDTRLRAQHAFLLRPPGVTNEAEFLSKCVRCTECLKVCPTTGLQPALNEAGLEGLWTPLLTPRVGYCDYGCNACGQVCPSQAIPKLSVDEKRQQIVGKASVNRDRCLPWASNTPCIVCEEMCPTPEKAIHLENVRVVNEAGETIDLQRPYVLREVCIGCGICENRCPLEGEAAIRVYSV
jgi:polyferredoxin